MIYERDSAWAWARGTCDECGLKCTAELEPHETAKLRRPWHFKMRATLRAQIETWFRQHGCVHT